MRSVTDPYYFDFLFLFRGYFCYCVPYTWYCCCFSFSITFFVCLSCSFRKLLFLFAVLSSIIPNLNFISPAVYNLFVVQRNNTNEFFFFHAFFLLSVRFRTSCCCCFYSTFFFIFLSLSLAGYCFEFNKFPFIHCFIVKVTLLILIDFHPFFFLFFV